MRGAVTCGPDSVSKLPKSSGFWWTISVAIFSIAPTIPICRGIRPNADQTHSMTIRLHRGDLPDLARYASGAVAIDTETMGLNLGRDRLCLVQLSPGDGSADVV